MSKEYLGTALHKSLGDNERASGEITFQDTTFVFQNSEIRIDIPISDLKIEMVKSGITLYYFSHNKESDFKIYTSDKSILFDQALYNNVFSEKIKSELIDNKFKTFMSIVLFLVLISATIFFGLKGIDKAVEFSASLVPVELEIKLGELAFAQYELTADFVESPNLLPMISKLTDPLVSSLGDKRYPFKFYIVKDEEINAFALPGGHVILTTGFIEFAKSPEELVGVLAHEIAHIQNRHSITQIIRSLGIFAVVQLFFGDVTGIGAVLLDSSSFLLTQSYSREFEQDADLTGLKYMVEANINPQGIINFFENLQIKESTDKSSEIAGFAQRNLAFLSTHPETIDRIRVLKLEIDKLPIQLKNLRMNFDLEEFQKTVVVAK